MFALHLEKVPRILLLAFVEKIEGGFLSVSRSLSNVKKVLQAAIDQTFSRLMPLALKAAGSSSLSSRVEQNLTHQHAHET